MAQQKTALLVMDVQKGIVDNYIKKDESYLERVETAVEAARKAGAPVMFVVVRFREGYPEVSPNNKSFSAIAERTPEASMEESSPNTQPVIKPQNGELVISKKRVSAFAGSDLEMILRAQEINHIVLCGIATSGVVLSTLRQAADRDYQLTVLSDCCADNDEEVHRILLEKVFPRQAEVITAKEWVQTLGKSA
jgi:nicotinamidase-related amidase